MSELANTKALRELGFERRRCRVCGSWFWSLTPRETCGDAPCERYRFLEIGTKSRFTYLEARNAFLEFFRRHGHEIIPPKPVVARWREDLYLTIASIVVFQPHVTSGLVPPPANPLVIAQPCIRLEDIDNVGYTMGRHLTNFIMGGHHAFNYPNKRVYWIDETVKYAYEFFTNVVGVPPEELTFKESWWEGGGNAGPAFEVCFGGLELATLVFMKYETVSKELKEMPIKVVDTGYGIERIAWISSRAPTAFHAVYGELVNSFAKTLGIELPSNDFLIHAVVCSQHLGEDPLKAIAQCVSRELGVNENEAHEMLSRLVNLFSLLDHTKTIALMLGDGIVPSNSGEGYLARLVIRRALRRLALLGIEEDVLKRLVEEQIRYWGGLYPQMLENKGYILEALDVEIAKFRDIMRKLETIAKRFAKKRPTLDDLITLYDSHGIPPDILKEYLEKRFGITIDVPRNFFSIVASRHVKPEKVRSFEETKLPKDIMQEVVRLGIVTDNLFHKDPYMRSFTGKVVWSRGRYVVLDRTAFYPEGGGQLGDCGWLKVGSEVYRVVDTQKAGSAIVHVLDRECRTCIEGSSVIGVVDWSKRYRRMRHHTATHIVLAAARRVLGSHVWQAGAEKNERFARLDITHYKSLTEEDIAKIENLANEIVSRDLPVLSRFMDRNEAESRYGYVIYQGGVPPVAKLRIVEIPGWDVEACFGTHVKRTSEVGAIKIVSVDRIADGVVRLVYVAGDALRDYVKELESSIRDVARVVGASSKNVVDRVRSLVAELEHVHQLLDRYRKSLALTLLDRASSSIIKGCPVLVLGIDLEDPELVKEIIELAYQRYRRVGVVLVYPRRGRLHIEIALSKEGAEVVSAREIMDLISQRLKIRGGGKKDHITGVIEGVKEVGEAAHIIAQILKAHQS